MVDPLEEDTSDGLEKTEEATEVGEVPTVSGAPPPKPLSFTRGMNIRAATGWVRDRYGEGGVSALARSLPLDVVGELGGPSLKPSPTSWTPFLAHAQQLEHIDAIFGDGDLELLREVGRGMAKRDFPAIARPIAALLSPGFFLDMATKIWGLYHTHGSWEISRGDREIQGLLVNRPENHPAFCMAMRGWVEGALMFCGAVDVDTQEERCAAQGAPLCSLRMTWREKRDGARDRRPRPPT